MHGPCEAPNKCAGGLEEPNAESNQAPGHGYGTQHVGLGLLLVHVLELLLVDVTELKEVVGLQGGMSHMARYGGGSCAKPPQESAHPALFVALVGRRTRPLWRRVWPRLWGSRSRERLFEAKFRHFP